MILVILFTIIEMFFLFAAGRFYGQDTKFTVYLTLSALVCVFSILFILNSEISDDTTTKNKTTALLLLVKDNKVSVEINENYTTLTYILKDSTLTNTFNYLNDRPNENLP